ncbi:MAG: S10 family peptidase [Planctomycetota bacterium]|jgi:carboxypeptidase C (cathepsin A)
MSHARFSLVSALLLCLPAPAQEQDVATRQHKQEIAGKTIEYTTHTGRMPLLDGEGAERAQFFFAAYLLHGVSDKASRPITFVYNGGPGSASLWLHLGMLGPRRVVLSDRGDALAPSGQLVDNESSWLAESDLVFLDPVGTGYSRPAEGRKQSEFSGYQEDIETVGDFIRQMVAHLGRWESPKYLAGESYGTMRSAGLSGYLQDRHHMFLDGIVLISTVLDYGTKRFAPGHDLPYALHLPTFAATAWYHKKLPAEKQGMPLREFLDEVEAFALNGYLTALAQGDQLSPDRRRETLNKLSTYTGLSSEFIDDADLRVNLSRFAKELLRDEGFTVGRLDSRYRGRDRDSAGEGYEYDSSMANIDGPFSSAINHYIKAELGYESPLIYESMSRRVRPWNYSAFENAYVNSADTLRLAMSKNPYLRVLVTSGYYDQATPYFAADYTFSHMGLPPELRKNLQVQYFEAGHMMYIDKASRDQMKRAVSEFYDGKR